MSDGVAEQKLLGKAWKLEVLLNNSDVYFYAKDLEGRYTFVNESVCSLFGRKKDEIIGHKDDEFFTSSSPQSLSINDQKVTQSGESVRSEDEIVLAESGESRLFWSIKTPLRDKQQNIIGLSDISIDITDQKHHTDEIIAQNKLLRTVLENVDAYIYQKARDGRYLYVNKKVAELYGKSVEEIIGHADNEILPSDVAGPLMLLDRLVFETGKRHARQEMVRNVNGEQRRFWSVKVPLQLHGQPPSLIGFSSDITELLDLKRNLEMQLTTDILTGLPNRAQFEEILKKELFIVKCSVGKLAVMMIDLDNFKYLNNTLGNEAGDQILRMAARRLDDFAGEKMKIARFSSNLFAVILNDENSEGVARTGEALRMLLAEPFQLEGQQLHLTASIGISLYPDDGEQAEELITNAESALYFAKDKGRDQFRFYSPDIGKAVIERATLERSLRQAIAYQQFELHYQPKIKLSNNEILGLEALVRWNRNEHELMRAAAFIPLAEQLGLINQLGDWVIHQACWQISEWDRQGLKPIPVAVNLSPYQLLSEQLVASVSETMREFNVDHDRLEMEITESIMMEDPDVAFVQLQALRDLGVRLAIDDFGTGYSCMSYLKKLPVDTLKLDRSFINNVDSIARDAELCAGIIALAHKLGLYVVAEGVETQAQYEVLLGLECDIIQGHLYSPPLPSNEITEFLMKPSSKHEEKAPVVEV